MLPRIGNFLLIVPDEVWKCVFLHNGNQYALVPLAHSTTMKEKYEETKVVLENISYYEHNLVIYVDIKMVIFFLGEQSGYTCGIVETK